MCIKNRGFQAVTAISNQVYIAGGRKRFATSQCDKECALGHNAEGFYQRDALVQQSDLRVRGNHLHMDDPWGHGFLVGSRGVPRWSPTCQNGRGDPFGEQIAQQCKATTSRVWIRAQTHKQQFLNRVPLPDA